MNAVRSWLHRLNYAAGFALACILWTEREPRPEWRTRRQRGHVFDGYEGLKGEAHAARYVRALRYTDTDPALDLPAVFVAEEPPAAGDVFSDVPEVELHDAHPIFDLLEAEFAALAARRDRALRTPTAEVLTVFDGMTSLLDLEWLCDHCEDLDHGACPGCPCPADHPHLYAQVPA